VGSFHLGAMPSEQVEATIRLFGTEVIPQLQ
jgi:hypothetical protein